MYKTLLPLLFVTSAIYAAETDPMADACSRLVAALTQEAEVLEKMSSAAEVRENLPELKSSLTALEDLFAVDEKALWQYIDNTEGAKQPVVDALELVALQFMRLEKAGFFADAELRALLAPQILSSPAAKKAKREKLRAIDPDED